MLASCNAKPKHCCNQQHTASHQYMDNRHTDRQADWDSEGHAVSEFKVSLACIYQFYNTDVWTNKTRHLSLCSRDARKRRPYSSPCSQTVGLSPAISSRLLPGYRSLMPSCTGFLEPRKCRLGPSKSTFNAENFIHSLSMSISIGFGAIHSCNVSRSPKLPKKINPLFWRSRSFKLIELGANREPVYDFLLVINSNLGPISHHYWDTVTYWPKIANFAHPLSFSALIRGDPLWIYEKALRFMKLESSWQPMVKICTVFAWSTRVTDGQNCDG